jgi:hypothetical protein
MTAVGSEDSGETLNRHGETGNGPNANVGLSSTSEKKEKIDSRSYAARGRSAWNQEISTDRWPILCLGHNINFGTIWHNITRHNTISTCFHPEEWHEI